MNSLTSKPATEPLSERELAVVRLLAKGKTNREIAQELFLSPETIKWYNKQIFQKLGVTNRAEAVAKSREQGYFSDGQRQKPLQASVASNIPVNLTPILGRQRETDELLKLLREVRLVTITGPGGIGKTSLGLHVAGKIGHLFSSGARFISLATTRHPDQVAGTIARELGVVEKTGRSLVESLHHFLTGKELLLFLDNFEHVIEAAPLVTDLLSSALNLTILVTSRELLRLVGEHEYPLYPLPVPSKAEVTTAAELDNFAATALFTQRAIAASPTFGLSDENALIVAAICRRLDGLPLAIELAAAWVRIFDPPLLLEQLEKRLALLTGGPRDVPDRQRTLRNTMEWSYRLLPAEEQQLFNRLAVFVGGRSLEAVAYVALPGLPLDPVGGLSKLFNKSLIYKEEGPGSQPRFLMLETIHEFAWERLTISGEDSLVRDRHLDYFLSFAEKMAAGYRWHDQLRHLMLTGAEIDNLQAAFLWAMDNEKYEEAARLVSALDYYFYYHDSPAEGSRWLLRLQPHLDQLPELIQNRLLLAVGRLAWANNQLESALSAYERCLDQSRRTGDQESEAWSSLGLAVTMVIGGSHSQGIAHADSALVLFRQLEDLPGIAQTLVSQGELARLSGDMSLARQKYEAALVTSRKTGEIYRQTMVCTNLSLTFYNEGDYQQAFQYSTDALHNWMKIKARQGMISELGVIAGPIARLGQPSKAATLMAASFALFDELGADQHPTDKKQIGEYRDFIKETLGEEAFDEAWAKGRELTLPEAIGLALAE